MPAVGHMINIYGGKLPYEVPAYSPTEAARYIRIPVSTVRSWLKGYWYRTKSGSRLFRHVVEPAHPTYLSFQNLVELFILHSIRRIHDVSLNKVRVAVQYLKDNFKKDHPFWDYDLLTDKTDLFIKRMNEYLNISQEGQWEIKEELKKCMTRIEKGKSGLPERLFPYVKSDTPDIGKTIQIDPMIQFGRPCIAGTGIPTEIVFDRFRAGENVKILAFDYDCKKNQIQYAIDYEEDIRSIAV